MTSLDEQLELAVAELLAGEEAATPVAIDALAQKYPAVADDLREFAAVHLRLTTVSAPLRQSVGYVLQQWGKSPVADTASASDNERTLDLAVNGERNRNPSGRIDLMPNSRFGDYELIDELGRGGMGVVYKARHVRLKRIVALKMVLAGRFAEDSDLSRFREEALTAAALDHPGIVPIHEAGEVEGVPYFSMGFIEGASLADLIKQGPLPPAEAARLMRRIAAAVAYAHAQGVIHRDLKPANILLARGEGGAKYDPKITDFGLARRLNGESHLTTTGQVLGTPSYMSPEQASGNPHSADVGADVYSLGAILFALLTGRPPFVGNNPMETLLQVLEKDPPSLCSLNAKVPRELEWICLKCLEKKAGDRYATAGELADDLDRFLRQEPPEARAGSWWQRLRRWARREPVFAAHVGGLSLVLVLVQFIFVGHSEREVLYHLSVSGVLLAWIAGCGILKLLARLKFLSTGLPFAWSGLDVSFLTAVLALLVAPLGLLFGSYHVLIAAAGLFFRVRLVVTTTLLAMLGSGLLLVFRAGAAGPWHYGLFLETTLALAGFFVGYHVWRLGILREYYEERRGRS